MSQDSRTWTNKENELVSSKAVDFLSDSRAKNGLLHIEGEKNSQLKLVGVGYVLKRTMRRMRHVPGRINKFLFKFQH